MQSLVFTLLGVLSLQEDCHYLFYTSVEMLSDASLALHFGVAKLPSSNYYD